MKLAPVSADLLIKLALIAAGIGLAVYLVRRTTGALGEGLDQARKVLEETADGIIIGTNPVNPENYANRAVTAAGSAIVGATGPGRNADGSWTPGAWLFDVTHPAWSTASATPAASGAQASLVNQYDGAGNYLGPT